MNKKNNDDLKAARPPVANSGPIGADGRVWLPPEEQEQLRSRFYELLARQSSADAHVRPLRRGPSSNGFVMLNDEGEDVGPTPERLAHARGEDGDVLGHQIDIRDHDLVWQAYSLRDSVLGRLHYRKKPVITLQHLMAGERFYGVVSDAGFIPNMSADTTRTIVDGGEIKVEADRLIAAREVHRKIYRAMHPNHWHIVEAIAVQGTGLAEYAECFRTIRTGGEMIEVKRKQDRQLIAAERLRSGLDWLIEFFGIGERKRGIVSSRGEAAHVVTRAGSIVQRLPGRKERAT